MTRLLLLLILTVGAFAQRTESRWSHNGGWTELRIDGKIEFADDESDVKSLSPGGRFLLIHNGRRYEVVADASGNLKKTPNDDSTRAWLRGLIPELLRETGIDAENRARRFLKAGGPAAVLTETQKIRSDSGKRRYITELFAAATLTAEHMQTAMRLVRGMHSDGERARVLETLVARYMKNGLREYYFDAVFAMQSDGERRRVLEVVVDRDSSPPALVLVSRAAERMNSDGERARVLMSMAGQGAFPEDVRRAFFRAVDAMHSDGERRRVLESTIRPSSSRDLLSAVCRSSAAMSSDGERTRVLMRVAEATYEDESTRKAFFSAVAAFNSDGERRRTLEAYLGRANLSREGTVEAVNSTVAMHSDGEKSRVLVRAAERSGGDPQVRAAIEKAIQSMNSDGEYRRVRTALR